MKTGNLNRLVILAVISFLLTGPIDISVGASAAPQAGKRINTAIKPLPVTLTVKEASHFAALALKCVDQEYPNQPGNVLNDAADAKQPHRLHPAFYGCFDWHSCVHGHWMLVRLLKTFPDMPEAAQIRKIMDKDLTTENIKVEVAYLDEKNHQSFERTYGWAWLLKLADELHHWDDPDAKRWLGNIDPLAKALAEKYVTFLPKQTYPIRVGIHPNTAFGLIFALDYAHTFGNQALIDRIVERARSYFGKDVNYPAGWEPSSEDFLSPALEEADLMRRIMRPAEFAVWFHRFLPGIATGRSKLLTPAIVTDRTDPRLVHLDGLNLSRAWCLRGIAGGLPATDPARPVFIRSAELHARAGLEHVASGEYGGEHWLASFAIYLLSNEGV